MVNLLRMPPERQKSAPKPTKAPKAKLSVGGGRKSASSLLEPTRLGLGDSDFFRPSIHQSLAFGAFDNLRGAFHVLNAQFRAVLVGGSRIPQRSDAGAFHHSADKRLSCRA